MENIGENELAQRIGGMFSEGKSPIFVHFFIKSNNIMAIF
jgi:hypothetical protein